jgi:hypothetical protein
MNQLGCKMKRMNYGATWNALFCSLLLLQSSAVSSGDAKSESESSVEETHFLTAAAPLLRAVERIKGRSALLGETLQLHYHQSGDVKPAPTDVAAPQVSPPSFRLTRWLDGEEEMQPATDVGFHREIFTRVELNLAVAGVADLSAASARQKLLQCNLMLLETVPRTAYLDLYQLRALYSWNSGLSSSSPGSIPVRVLAYRDIELERPAEVSREYLVWLQLEQTHRAWTIRTTPGSNVAHATIEIAVPAHVRYQAAAAAPRGTEETVHASHAESIWPAPEVFIRCPAGVSIPVRDKEMQVTEWTLLITTEDAPAAHHNIKMRVPIGNMEHSKKIQKMHARWEMM